jgi:hypothetical protein
VPALSWLNLTVTINGSDASWRCVSFKFDRIKLFSEFSPQCFALTKGGKSAKVFRKSNRYSGWLWKYCCDAYHSCSYTCQGKLSFLFYLSIIFWKIHFRVSWILTRKLPNVRKS